MNIFKKLISVLLAVVLVLTVIPVSAFGKTEDDNRDTFKCAWFNETLTYPYEYDDSYFNGSDTEYHHELAKYALCVAMASFNSFDKEKGDEHIKALLENCGFQVKSYGYETEGYDTVGVAIGKKLIDGYNVLIFAIRSGNYGMEWGGNLRVGSGNGDHEGFRIAADTLIGYLNAYFKENLCQGKTKILIPGYSRGGSIANLTAAALDDGSYKKVLKEKDYIAGVDVKELYTYTFEAPQCTTSKNTKDKTYSNIFNIVNPNDYVPMFVMDEWGFDNYGVRIEMPGADNCSDYNSYYERVCKEFDSYMGVNDRKAKDCFYSAEDSRSAETTLRHIFSDLAEDVMKDREFFHENYESSIVFFAGQYLGKKRTAKDFARTMGFILLGTTVGISPKNIEKIKNEGYRKYLASYLAQKNDGELTAKEIEGTLNVISALLEYVNANRRDVKSLFDQVNTLAQVHQPFVALAWMRALNENDVETINGDLNYTLKLSCEKVLLKYKVNGMIVARYDKNAGHIEWKSADNSIVTVDEKGNIFGTGKGTTEVTATLVSEKGETLAQKSVQVTIKMNAIQVVVAFIKDLV